MCFNCGKECGNKIINDKWGCMVISHGQSNKYQGLTARSRLHRIDNFDMQVMFVGRACCVCCARKLKVIF